MLVERLKVVCGVCEGSGQNDWPKAPHRFCVVCGGRGFVLWDGKNLAAQTYSAPEAKSGVPVGTITNPSMGWWKSFSE